MTNRELRTNDSMLCGLESALIGETRILNRQARQSAAPRARFALLRRTAPRNGSSGVDQREIAAGHRLLEGPQSERDRQPEDEAEHPLEHERARLDVGDARPDVVDFAVAAVALGAVEASAGVAPESSVSPREMSERVVSPTFSGSIAGDRAPSRPREYPESLPIGETVTFPPTVTAGQRPSASENTARLLRP